MAKYAGFKNDLSGVAPVTGWYDADNHSYSIDFTDTTKFLALTDAQWDNRLNGQWAVQNGQLISFVPVFTLEQAQKIQNSKISLECQQQITSGFASSALGAAHNYASDAVSQRNILLAAQCAKGGLLSCADSSGVWSRQPHTQAQAQQVLEDFVTVRDVARTKLTRLEAQVASATTVEAVQAVVWG